MLTDIVTKHAQTVAATITLQVKLPFGNRGQNQPVRNLVTGDCYITPQNHGYAIGMFAIIAEATTAELAISLSVVVYVSV
jgi:carbamoylphosphate synthase small subunit